MCGRYRLSRRKEVFAEHFHADISDFYWEPRYNIAPTQQVPVIRLHERAVTRRASLVCWGLIPYWAKSPSIATSTINAKSETAATKPAFRYCMESRRCLIPADGFYEWRRHEKVKQPFCFEVSDGGLFAFAGLWDRWRERDGNVLETCTILTTTANELMRNIHNRMPVILPADRYDRWLDPMMRDPASAVDLLRPFDPKFMRCYPVSRRVNAVANDGPECSAPIEVPQGNPTLFG